MPYYFYIKNILSLLFQTLKFEGWGRKKTGRFAVWCHKKFGGDLTLLEDGFIRSVGLGIDDSPSFSLVEDDIGIYYDARVPSKLENILNTYDFKKDKDLMAVAKQAIDLILKYNISKYNNSSDVDEDFCKKYNLGYRDSQLELGMTSDFNDTSTPLSDLAKQKNILIIAQTAGDSSLEYGLGNTFTTNEVIQAAIKENPGSKIYLKIHPDVLSGKKYSDIDTNNIPTEVTVITEDVNPISLLKYFDKVYTKTSQMGFEAILVGCKCVCFGMPFYAGWGITDDRIKCERRNKRLSIVEVFAASYILYTRYFNPYTNKQGDIIDTIKTIIRYKDLEKQKNKRVYLFGFSRWKHSFVRAFLKEYGKDDIVFINPVFKSHCDLALKKGLDKNSDIFIWGKKEYKEIESFANSNDTKITRMEDGFIRSVGLGSDLTPPFSLVIDEQGIYFDPTTSSSLETILNTYDFASNKEILEDAKALRKKILETKISKYNADNHKKLNLPKDKRKLLVSGQVEDDASIRFGANGMTNLQLLKEVYADNNDAYIIFKPHPDVLSGNRVGNVDEKIALKYCDEVLVDISMSSVLNAVDEVHTMTSLTGFEGLMYGKDVYTYGMPFFAGWGLTVDKIACERRKRILTLDELCAGVLILYPRYIHPKTKNYCDPIVLIDELQKEKERIDNSIIYGLKIKTLTYFNRTIQKLLILSLVK